MPQVPYTPYPTDEAARTPTLSTSPMRIEVPDMTGPGRALKELGNSITQFGNTQAEIALRHQNLQNGIDANNADMGVMVKLGDALQKFRSLDGEAAVNALPQLQQTLQQIRTDALAGVGNSNVRRQLDQLVTRRVAYALGEAGGHAGTEQKNYANKTASARVDTLATGRPDISEDEFQLNQDQIEKTLSEQNQTETGPKLPPEELKNRIDVAKGVAWQSRIQYMAMHDPQGAYKLYQDRKEQIPPVVWDKIERNLDTAMRTTGAGQVAEKLYGENAGGDYYTKLEGKESPNGIPNPNSTAKGHFQIIDGTWNDIRKAHPELELDPTFNPAQEKKAIRAFTSDNLGKLVDEGFSPTQKNAYLLHFMGTNGGIDFLKTMKANPDANAASLFPKAAQFNSTVFFKPDGTARSLTEVYNLQTSRFANGPVGSGDGAASIATMQEKARTYAKENYPNVPGLDVAINNQIEHRYNQDKTAVRAEQINNLSVLQNAVFGLNGTDPIKDIADIQKDPTLSDAFNNLDPAHQIQMQRAILRNRTNVPVTPEVLQRYETLKGMSRSDPATFADSFDFTRENLPQGMLKSLADRQMQIQQNRFQPNVQTSQVMKTIEDTKVFEQLHVKKGSDKYNQLYSQAEDAVETWIKIHGDKPTSGDLQKITQELMRSVSQPGKLFGNVWPNQVPAFTQKGAGADASRKVLADNEQVPDDFRQTVQQQYKNPLSETELRKVWLTNKPAWFRAQEAKKGQQ